MTGTVTCAFCREVVMREHSRQRTCLSVECSRKLRAEISRRYAERHPEFVAGGAARKRRQYQRNKHRPEFIAGLARYSKTPKGRAAAHARQKADRVGRARRNKAYAQTPKGRTSRAWTAQKQLLKKWFGGPVPKEIEAMAREAWEAMRIMRGRQPAHFDTK